MRFVKEQVSNASGSRYPQRRLCGNCEGPTEVQAQEFTEDSKIEREIYRLLLEYRDEGGSQRSAALEFSRAQGGGTFLLTSFDAKVKPPG